MTLAASDDSGITHYFASESTSVPSAEDTGWISYQSSGSFTITGVSQAGTYPRTVHVWFKDAEGNISESVSDSIELVVSAEAAAVADTTAPTAESVELAGGAGTTNTTSIQMVLSATDDVGVTHYFASETFSPPTADQNGWNSYQTSVSFTLTGAGSIGTYPRTVYVWFKDATGNVSAHASDSISLVVLDTEAPSALSVSIDNGASSTSSSTVNLQLSATDNAGVTHYYASESSTTPQSGDFGWKTYASSVSYSFSNSVAGIKRINVWFKDAAGNVSSMVFGSVELNSIITVRKLESGPYHVCAILSNQEARCWGLGGLGIGSTDVPTYVGFVSDISAGYNHTCAIKTNGMAICWGNNDYGQTSVPSGLGSVRSISAGYEYTCAVKTNGIPQCWGKNFYNSTYNSISNARSVSTISAAYSHTCYLRENGTGQCVGNPGKASHDSHSLDYLEKIEAAAYITVYIDNDINWLRGSGYDINDNLFSFSNWFGNVTDFSAGWNTICGIKKTDGKVKVLGR